MNTESDKKNKAAFHSKVKFRSCFCDSVHQVWTTDFSYSFVTQTCSRAFSPCMSPSHPAFAH